MKNFIKPFGIALITLISLTACQQNLSESIDTNTTESLSNLDLSSEELLEGLDAISFSYPVTVIDAENTELEISDDTELESYCNKVEKPTLVFPIEVTVDGETITINSEEELKELMPRRKHKRPELVFPVTVTTESGDIEIGDIDTFKAYKDSLEEGTHPEFVFPIDVIVKGETVTINSEEELKELMPKRKHKRPELVFPVTVTTESGDIEIGDIDTFKAYKDSLEEGTHPEFVFPISVIVKGETVTINSKEELKELIHKKRNH